MKARTVIKKQIPGKINIMDVVDDHPYLTPEQKQEAKDNFNKYVNDIAVQGLKQLVLQYNHELTAEAMLVLHEEFGFGEQRLKRFGRTLDEMMTKCAIELNGVESVCVVAMHELRNKFPNCDEWFEEESEPQN